MRKTSNEILTEILIEKSLESLEPAIREDIEYCAASIEGQRPNDFVCFNKLRDYRRDYPQLVPYIQLVFQRAGFNWLKTTGTNIDQFEKNVSGIEKKLKGIV